MPSFINQIAVDSHSDSQEVVSHCSCEISPTVGNIRFVTYFQINLQKIIIFKKLSINEKKPIYEAMADLGNRAPASYKTSTIFYSIIW